MTTADDDAAQDQDSAAGPDRFAPYLWPRPPHPFVRKLDPRRARRRWRVRRAVRYEPFGPPITEGAATDIRSITFWYRDQRGWPIGKLNYLVCHQCRICYVGDLDVQKNLWGNGIATAALAHLRRQLPGYTWQTSRHYPTAKSFWLLIAERTGAGYTDENAGYVCDHMARFWSSGPTYWERDD
ncbi:hypothetical protein [Nocardia altamirensis]|uniref:hypothetical protein n=1 Tax=Nocardia altamirensis TaxID=472158 RepID=UPI0008408282|nr:hypothetical protein [Nocardia altamirensis]